MKWISLLLAAVASGGCSRGLGPVVPTTPAQRQMIGLLQKFDRWDDDGSGDLDRHELAVGLRGTPYKAAKVLAFYDTDHNGRISLSEAQAGYNRASQAEQYLQH